ncbi:DUF938 domain-containing protein [Salinisphaera orenii]|uniref:DUF938 domain-containing protein n=1 Tax=Salinisphaera orenii TaxID=856731 RepID=UPI000DBE974B
MTEGIGNSSAAERNKRPIFEALLPWLHSAASVLEVGAGDATHARYAAHHLPATRWQTSEAPGHVRRLAAAIADDRSLSAQHLPTPLALDVRQRWPDDVYDAVFAANVAHIMDWNAVEALFAGAGTHLAAAGVFCLYGPFFDAAEGPPAAGNERFDRVLRAQDAAMGVRELAELDELAGHAGLTSTARIDMPANNRLVIWRRD